MTDGVHCLVCGGPLPSGGELWLGRITRHRGGAGGNSEKGQLQFALAFRSIPIPAFLSNDEQCAVQSLVVKPVKAHEPKGRVAQPTQKQPSERQGR